MEKQINLFSFISSFLCAFAIKFLGGSDQLLWCLIFFVIIDYITGIMKAIYTKKLSSSASFKGIAKKISIFLIVAVSVQLEVLIGGSIPLRDTTVMFYLINECISLIENVSEFLPVPAKITDVLAQLQKGKP